MKKINLTFLSVVTALLMSSCYYDNFKELHPESAITPNTCDTISAISYSAQIVPIINAACIQCHTSGGSAHDMTNYAAVNADAVSGFLYSDVYSGSMPQGGPKLSDCDITKIKKWVDAGAPNN